MGVKKKKHNKNNPWSYFTRCLWVYGVFPKCFPSISQELTLASRPRAGLLLVTIWIFMRFGVFGFVQRCNKTVTMGLNCRLSAFICEHKWRKNYSPFFFFFCKHDNKMSNTYLSKRMPADVLEGGETEHSSMAKSAPPVLNPIEHVARQVSMSHKSAAEEWIQEFTFLPFLQSHFQTWHAFEWVDGNDLFSSDLSIN